MASRAFPSPLEEEEEESRRRARLALPPRALLPSPLAAAAAAFSARKSPLGVSAPARARPPSPGPPPPAVGGVRRRPSPGGRRRGGARTKPPGAMGGPGAPYSCLVGGLLLAAAWPSPGADACPSSSWISFGSSCYALLHATIDSIDDARELCKVNASGADIVSINNKEENTFIWKTFRTHWHGPEYISLGMFFDTDDDVFKWYDESKVNFTNWMEEESSNDLDTCAIMHTPSGRWKNTRCEHLPLTEILCEDIPAYEKKYLPDKSWTTFLVVSSTVIVSVSAALLWFLYQRKISSMTFMAHNFSSQTPCNDEVILIDEENEYTA